MKACGPFSKNALLSFKTDNPDTMLTLHHLEDSQSIRILWLLEELGLDYELKSYAREPGTGRAPEAYRAISPLKTAPAITDGPVALAESNAIIEYILDRAPEQTLRPAAGDPDRTTYLFWFHAAQGSYQSAMTGRHINALSAERSEAAHRRFITTVMSLIDNGFYAPRIGALMETMEDHLSKSAFLAGARFTAADIAFGYTLQKAVLRGDLPETFDHTRSYIKRIEDRPAWKAALRKDGSFQGATGRLQDWG